MIEHDFPGLRRAAQSSLAARMVRSARDSVLAARGTSWTARHIDRSVERARIATTARRVRSGVLMIATAALTHFLLVLPAPAYARSALPMATPLLVAAVALVIAFAVKPGRRR